MSKIINFRDDLSADRIAAYAINVAKGDNELVALKWRGVELEVWPTDTPGILTLLLENGGTLPAPDVELVPEVMVQPSAFDCTRDGHFPRLGV